MLKVLNLTENRAFLNTPPNYALIIKVFNNFLTVITAVSNDFTKQHGYLAF